MKLKKLFVFLLALLVVLSFAGCSGGGGGSDDDNTTVDDGTGGGNGGNGGDNGGGGDEDPPALTWPVSYRADLHALDPENPEGSFAYVNFNENNTYEFGNCIDGITPIPGGNGTYSGDDPHNDGTVNITGDWTTGGPPTSVEGYALVITGGTFEYAAITVTRQ